MTPQSAGIARVDRAFDESPDRYSCAFLLRPALQDARDLVFSKVGRPTATDPYPAIGAARAYSLVVDRLLERAYRFVARYVGAGDELGDLPLALIATGSYGRRELCPFSGVDLLVVHRGPQLETRAIATIEAMLPFLSDAGFPVTHRVRSLGEVGVSLKEELAGTAPALDGRFLGGDAGLFQEFQRAVCRPYMEKRGVDEFTRQVSHARHRVDPLGPTSSQKAPDLLESAGGLRDVHAAFWMDRAVRAAHDLRERPLFPWDAREGIESLQEVLDAHEFLLSVRVHAHMDAGRMNDRLDLATWEGVAVRRSRAQGGGPVAVPSLMRRYHRQARVIGGALDRLLDEVRALREEPPAAGDWVPVPSGSVTGAFVRHADQLSAGDEGAFERAPSALLEAFRMAQQLGLRPSHRLLLQARRAASRLSGELQHDPRSAALFRAVWEDTGRAAQGLRYMHRAGVLSAWLPEFAAVTGVAPFDPAHEYTVDEHSLRAVELVDRLERGLGDEHRREVIRRVPGRGPLKLALLLHDVGARDGWTCVESALSALPAISTRLALDAEEADVIAFLIEHQRLMADACQRSELHDRAVLDPFVRQVGTPERLRLLYLFTYADLAATSRGALTRWVDHLLSSLYTAALGRLPHVAVEPVHGGRRARDRGGRRR